MEPILTRFVREPHAYTLDFYLEHEGYEGLRKALAMKPEQVIEIVTASGLKGRGGAGFPAGMKWKFVVKDTPRSEIHRLQRRRERARNVQGSSVDGAQPASAVRGLPDRLPRDWREGGVHLYPRRISARAGGARAAARGGVQAGLRRQERDGAGMGLRHLHSSGGRGLRGRRRDRAARVA